jgi:hypothetical protein
MDINVGWARNVFIFRSPPGIVEQFIITNHGGITFTTLSCS